ncbi:MAG: DegT/DnrJ/EryC1/StrS family aminotransferase, partial [Candidatus Binatia bacterium]
VTKNLMCGQGGALVVNDARAAERAGVLGEEGTDRERFVRGEVDKYTWNDLGSSYLMSEITAAFLWAQLEASALIDAGRQAIHAHYLAALAPLAARGLIELPSSPPECRHNAHLFPIVLPDAATCAGLHAYLSRLGIHAIRHYVPLHLSPMGARLGYRAGDLPVTENLSERLLRLPLWLGLERSDQDRVVGEIAAYMNGR